MTYLLSNQLLEWFLKKKTNVLSCICYIYIYIVWELAPSSHHKNSRFLGTKSSRLGGGVQRPLRIEIHAAKGKELLQLVRDHHRY